MLGVPILETSGLFTDIVHELLRENRQVSEDGTVLLLIAHGSLQPAARKTYDAAAAACHGMGTHVVLGTIMPPLELPSAIAACRETGAGRIVLVPFTLAAGVSTVQNIAGSSPASWRSALERAGFSCVPVLRGLGEYDGIVRLLTVQAGKLLEQAGREAHA